MSDVLQISARHVAHLIFPLVILTVSVHAQILSSNRWLFVVDTSSTMARRASATELAVGNLLATGLNGQARSGDTIGLWTFNAELFTGQYPLQLWRPEHARQLAAATAEFLHRQAYAKTANLNKVLPALNELVTNSDILTVILVTDGAGEIHGTPFDSEINAAFKQDFRYQQNARQPFVVVLRADGGQVTDYRVTLAPWLAALPPLPPPPPPPVAKKIETPPVVEKPKPPVVPPLILFGRKPTNSTPITAPPVEIPAQNLIKIETNAAVESPAAETKPAESTAVLPPPEKIGEQPAPKIPPVVAPPIADVAPRIPVIQTVPPTATATQIAAPFYDEKIKRPPTNLVKPPPLTDENVPPPSVTTTEAPAPAQLTEPAPVKSLTNAVEPSPPAAENHNRLLLGIGLIAAAIVLGIFWLRRSRPRANGSLITHSLDKDKR